ncbi:MAG: Tad domain-containing protein [Alphaproteobacteria bacterium]|nr:Tad domain-containing protein [Alphaproteobacteria bacterium]
MKSPASHSRNITSDVEGNVGIFFALALVPMLSVIGAAIDIGQAYTYKKQLQELTDAASVAGARLPATSNENRMNAIVTNFEHNAAAKNLIDLKPEYLANNAEVGVTASATSPTTILKLLGVESIPVMAKTRARSQVQNGGVICLLALDENAAEGLHLQGINKMSQQDCWAWVNAKADTAINAVGASTGKAQGFCVAGGVIGADHFAPPPFRGCDPYADPFAETFATNTPFVGECTQTNLKVKNQYRVLSPGTYCGGIDIGVHAEVEFMPGTYVIKDGPLNMDAQSSAAGVGVTFYFTGANTGIDIKSGSDLVLRAPTSGSYESFVFIQDKTSNPGAVVSIQGGGHVKLEGVLYTPTWQVSIGGNGEVNQEAKFWTMVAATFHMEGNGQLYINSDAEAIGMKNVMPKIPTGPLIMN